MRPMKSSVAVGSLLACLSAGAQAQGLDVKPGLWEVTIDGVNDAHQVCFTAEVLSHAITEQPNIPGVECKNEVKQASAALVVTHSTCTGPNVSIEGETRLEVTSRESMLMQSNSTMTMGGHKQPVDASVKYKWLRSDCGNIKPVDPKKPLG